MKFTYINENKGIISKSDIDRHEEYDARAIVLEMTRVRTARDYLRFLEAIPYSFFSKMFFLPDDEYETVLEFLPHDDFHVYKGNLAHALQREYFDIDYLDGLLIQEGVLGKPVKRTVGDRPSSNPKTIEAFIPNGKFEYVYMQSIEILVSNVQQLCKLAAIALGGKVKEGDLERDALWGEKRAHIVRSGLSVESDFNSNYADSAPIPMLFSAEETEALMPQIEKSGYVISNGSLDCRGGFYNQAFLVREEMSDAEVAAFIFTWFMNSLFEGSSEAYYSGNTFKVGFDGKRFKVFRQRSPYRELYLQVARFAELGQTKLCAHCGRAFIDTKSRGNEALYCSRSCNTKASNKRRDLAKQYKAAGVPVERAIKEIGKKYAESIRVWYGDE